MTIPLIDGNALHNKVATATNAFERILTDAPNVDIGWARDAALRIADIKLWRDTNAFANFTRQALRILANRKQPKEGR